MTDEVISYKYDVFISYSRKNEAFAGKLEQALENYQPEKSLNVPRRNIETFRDKEDFSSGDYHKNLLKNLQESSKLIVVCSPEARASRFVNDEIRRFVEVRGAEHIIPVLFSGIPNNEAKDGQESEMAFPDELCLAQEMPLAVNYLNFNPDKDKINRGIFISPWYNILADVYSLGRSEMEQREKKRRARSRRFAFAAMSASLAVLSVLLIFAIVSQQRALAAQAAEKEQKTIAEEQKLEADKQRDDAIQARNEATDAKKLADDKRKEAEAATEAEKIAKDQAEERRKQAEQATKNETIAKKRAEEQTAKANEALRAANIENGRQELLDGHPFKAVDYLDAAYQTPGR